MLSVVGAYTSRPGVFQVGPGPTQRGRRIRANSNVATPMPILAGGNSPAQCTVQPQLCGRALVISSPDWKGTIKGSAREKYSGHLMAGDPHRGKVPAVFNRGDLSEHFSAGFCVSQKQFDADSAGESQADWRLPSFSAAASQNVRNRPAAL